MTDDNTETTDIDFTAWEAPPMTNPQLADDVIAQLERSVPTPNHRRRIMIAGGALLVAAAVGGVVTFAITRGGGEAAPLVAGAPPPAPVEPTPARVYRNFPGATYEQKVELGDSAAGTSSSSSVDLSINAGFRAAREGHEIYVVDARGEANWQIGGQDRLHIALGKTKGFGIVIEPSEGRVITRIHTNADEPVHVEVVGGDGVRVHAYRGGREWLLTSASQSLAIDPPADWRLLDDKTIAIDPFATCDDHRRSADNHIMRNEPDAQLAELEAAYACDGRASDAVSIVRLACGQHDAKTAFHYFERIGRADTMNTIDVCHDAGIELVSCSAEEIASFKDKGTSDLSEGQDAAALRNYERAWACKQDQTLIPRMVLAACKSGNVAKAKQYYAKCDGACTTLVARCETNNIELP